MTSQLAIERTWYAVSPNGGAHGPVTFGVGLPRREADSGWAVAVSLGGIEPDPHKIVGEDGWQAVALGMRFVAARLADFSDRGWQFYWYKDGELANVESLLSG